jgi:hypothetical protein
MNETQDPLEVGSSALVRQSFRALGRDLFFDLRCICPYRSDNPVLAKLLTHTIKLSGYDDDNYHCNVIPNFKCEKCDKPAPENYHPLATKHAAHVLV